MSQITIRLINDCGIDPTSFEIITKAVQNFVPKVATAWNIPHVTVINGGTPAPTDWLVYATEKNRSLGALGYHSVKAGVPVAYCSLKAVGSKLFGLYHRALTVKGKVIRPVTYSTGLVTVFCHEIAEMLCDPLIQTLSPVDKLNRHWLVEVCDHVAGMYYMDGINVIPDVTTPAFYNLTGTAPYSILNSTNAPFTMTPKGYGYWRDDKGLLNKI
jgi:hypothetical protein